MSVESITTRSYDGCELTIPREAPLMNTFLPLKLVFSCDMSDHLFDEYPPGVIEQ